NEVYGLQGVFWEVIGPEREGDTAGHNLDKYMLLYQASKAAELRAEAAGQFAKEREALLKEIHHRVFNNLQRVADILSLATTSIADTHAREVMQACKTRLSAMAMVHRLLYKTDRITEVHLHNYLDELVKSILASHRNPAVEIATSCEIELAEVDVDLA